MHRIIFQKVFIALIIAGCFIGAGGNSRASDSQISPKVLKIGFDIRNTQLEDARQYQPFLDYLARATGYRFELRFTKKEENIIDLLGAGSVDFAFIGAQSYLHARQEYGVVPLARGLNSEGKAEYRSVIVVPPKSSIQRLDELRGKRFAFGSESSTQGYLIPLIVLAEHGISINDLGKYAFTGSHRNCAQAVARGDYDAGGMQDTLGHEYARTGLLRIIYTSRLFPSSGVVARRQIPSDVVARVKRALLDFRPRGEHAKGLYHWDKTEMPNGFTEAQDADYAELRKWALRLGVLRGKGE